MTHQGDYPRIYESRYRGYHSFPVNGIERSGHDQGISSHSAPWLPDMTSRIAFAEQTQTSRGGLPGLKAERI